MPFQSDARNISIDSTQILDEPISGKFLLSLLDAPINLIFSSNFGEITLKQLLVNEGKTIGCERYNCSGLYTSKDSGSTSLNFNASRKGVTYGLLYEEGVTSVTDLNFKVSANFPELATVPLSIAIGKNYMWNFNSVSEETNNFRQTSNGCFNSSAPLSDGEIDSLGYCEEVNLTASPAYYLGANVSGSGLKKLVFTLNKDGSVLESCTTANLESAAFSSPVGCMISMSDSQSAGKYEVCIKSNEDDSSIYSLKKETSGLNCGRYSSGNKLADYSIFVKVPYYASSNGLITLGGDFDSSAVDSINSYLASVYGNNCSSKCFVPITFYGNNVNVLVSDINSVYSSLTGPLRSYKLYSILEDVYRIDFSGIISLKSFNWSATKPGNNTLKIELVGDGSSDFLFSKSFIVESVPFAASVYPTSPPAGIDVYFYANIGGSFSKVIWNFGDGTPVAESNVSYVIHKYQNVSSTYNLTINVVGKNSTITKSFVLNTVSPEVYVNDSILFKRNIFNNLSLKIEGLPYSIRDVIKQRIGYDSLQNGLNQLEIDRVKAVSPEDYLSLVHAVDLLDVPYSVFEYETRTSSLASSYSEIDPSIVKKIKSGNYSNLDKYIAPIFAWQLVNVNSNIVRKKFEVIKKNNDLEKILVYYTFSLKSSSDQESYFIFKKPASSLSFSVGVDVKELDADTSYIQIPPLESLEFSVYYSGSDDLAMFISPSLEVLQAEEDISVCIVNDICQKDAGEDSDNCPQDCRAILPTTLAIIGVLLFMLVIYTILQIWYVRRYEEYLFKDRAFVFNLLAFINNSKLNGVNRNSIASALSSKGWNGEQIDYAIKKAEGKNTGMYEIIPVQLIIAYYEMKKAEKVKNIRVSAPSTNSNFEPRAPPRRGPGNLPINQYKRL